MVRVADRVRSARSGWAALLAVLSAAAPIAIARASSDLTQLSLEDLMNVEVTSVSKRSQSKLDSPASVHVITSEDLRRGGFTSVPEALRTVPGVQVARIGANRWAISVRGFLQEFSNKLLVMVDGRTVYSPIFGGTWWDAENLTIEDVDRIEVIRGPGGAIWGANAVNGVINIITKQAADTQGALASIWGGTQEYGITTRYGGQLGESTHYRLSAKAEKIEDYDFNQDYNGNDEWRNLRLGLRSDTEISDRDALSLHADFYDIDHDYASAIFNPAPPFNVTAFTDRQRGKARGGDVVLRYGHDFADGSSLEIKTYYDRKYRQSTSNLDSHTADFALQHDIKLNDWFGLIWGLDYRYWTTHSSSGTTPSVFNPNDEDFHRGGGFVQLRFQPIEAVGLYIGTKLTGNSWSGFEYQPSGRLVVRPHEGHSLWAAVSRAVRTPTYVDRDLQASIGPVVILGDRDMRSEELLAFELGYRFYALDWFTTEISGFYFLYEDFSVLVGPPPIGPFDFDNLTEVAVRGFEIESTFLPVERWRIVAGYSLVTFDEDGPSNPLSASGVKNQSPRHQVVLRSVLDLPWALEFDTSVYYVDGLPDIVPTLRSNNVTQYVRLDLRLGWKPLDWLEVSLVGQNLADARHAEFYDVQQNQSTQVPRSGYAKFTFEF